MPVKLDRSTKNLSVPSTKASQLSKILSVPPVKIVVQLCGAPMTRLFTLPEGGVVPEGAGVIGQRDEPTSLFDPAA